MSDPLSIAGSIAGLVQLTGALFYSILKYVESARGAKDAILRLATEMRNFSGLLQNLSLLAAELELSQTRKLVFQDSQVELWSRTAIKVRKRVDGDTGNAEEDLKAGGLRSKLRSLKWPFSEEETESLLAELHRHTSTIDLALSADTLHVLIECLGLQENIDRKAENMKNVLDSLHKMQTQVRLDEKKQKVIEFFLRVNPQPGLQASVEQRHQDTGTWLIRSHEFNNWKTTQPARLWLSGIPGSGKTTLCGLIIEQVVQVCYDSKGKSAVAFYFCDYKNEESQKPVNILAALAVQLSLQQLGALSLLEKYYDDLHPDHGLQKEPDRQRLKELLRNIFAFFEEVYIVVDGLDECSATTNTVPVTKDLRELSLEPRISTALISRNEVEIGQELVEDFQHLEIAAHNEDLEIFVSAEMAKRDLFRDMSTTLQLDMHKTLIAEANGMFRWVVCQLDYLESLPNMLRKEALRGLPPSLNETYERILERNRNSRTDEIIQKTLHWLCESKGNITIPELCEALSNQDPCAKRSTDVSDLIEEKDILRLCSSLIRKKHNSASFELAHFTVQEYLEALDPNSRLGFFRFRSSDAAGSLAVTSLRFLLLPDFRRRPVAKESERAKIAERRRKHPFYRYAARYWVWATWVHHRSEVECLIRDMIQFEPRRRSCFQNWLIEYIMWFCDRHDFKGVEAQLLGIVSFAQREDISPLHVASALALPWVCEILIRDGEDINHKGCVGTAMHCVLAGPEIFLPEIMRNKTSTTVAYSKEVAETVELLLKHGASSEPPWTGVSLSAWALKVCADSGKASLLRPMFKDLSTIQADTTEQLKEMVTRDSLKHSLKHDIFQTILDIENNSNEWAQHPEVARLISFVKIEIHKSGEIDDYDHAMGGFYTTSTADTEFFEMMQSAAKRDDAEEMQDWIEDGRFLQLGLRDPETGDSPLHIAVRENSLATIAVLLDSDHDYNFENKKGDYPIHFCSRDPAAEALRMLLASGMSEEVADASGKTIWHLAASNAATMILKILVDFPQDNKDAPLQRLSAAGRTPLAEAFSSSAQGSAHMLLENCGSNPGFFQSDVPLVHLAAGIGSLKLYEALISKRRELQQELAPDGSTPLHHVKPGAEPALVETLINTYGILEPRNDHKTPLQAYLLRSIAACSLRKSDLKVMIEYLLPKDLMVGPPDSPQHVWDFFCYDVLDAWRSPSHKDFPLMLLEALPSNTIQRYELECNRSPFMTLTKYILIAEAVPGYAWSEWLPVWTKVMDQDSTADDIIRGPTGVAILRSTIQVDSTDLVGLLLKRGADVNVLDDGSSALDEACVSGGPEVFLQILQDVDLDLLNGREKRSPKIWRQIILSCQSAAWRLAKIRHALELGIDPSLQPEEGYSAPPMFLAGDFCLWDAVHLLWDHGAIPSQQESTNRFDVGKVAAWWGREDVITRLQKDTSTPPYDWNSTCTLSFQLKGGKVSFGGCNILHVAAFRGHTVLLRFILEHDLVETAEPRTTVGNTPLHLTALSGSIDAARFLIRNGCDINAENTHGSTPVDLACWQGKMETAKMLMRRGSRRPRNRNHAEVCVRLLRSAPVQGEGIVRQGTMTDEVPSSQLLSLDMESAIVNGNLELCKETMKKGLDLNKPLIGCHGCSPLNRAARAGKSDIVLWLLEQGVKLDAQRCPMIHSALWGIIHVTVLDSKLSEACLGVLLDKALEIGYAWHDWAISPLHLAILHRNRSAVECIVQHAIDNMKAYRSFADRRERFICADEPKPGDFLSLLLNQKIVTYTASRPATKTLDVKAKLPDLAGASALHCAAYIQSTAAAKFLLDKGARADPVDRFRRTPLAYAARDGVDDLVSLLLDRGSELNPREKEGATPLMLATAAGKVSTVEVLLKRGAATDVLTMHRRNLLYLAVSAQSTELFRLFIDLGISPFQVDRFGHSAITFGCTSDRGFFAFIIGARTLAYAPGLAHLKENVLTEAVRGGKRVTRSVQHIFRSMPRSVAMECLNEAGSNQCSPLCLAAQKGFPGIARQLLDLGADPEREGSLYGTPVMAAAAFGRLDVVQLLVQRGVRVFYRSSEGESRSAVYEARYHPRILRWLLVLRFCDQGRLADAAANPGAIVKAWSGLHTIPYQLGVGETQSPYESSVQFVGRLQMIKASKAGKVVFPSLRPSKPRESADKEERTME